MEPAFYRGDILFLWNPESEPYVVGDITVYKTSVPSSFLYTVRLYEGPAATARLGGGGWLGRHLQLFHERSLPNSQLTSADQETKLQSYTA